MKIHKISVEAKYLHCYCTGEYDESEFIEILDKAIKNAIEENSKAAILDLLDVNGEGLNIFQRYSVGEKIALTQDRNEKRVAIVIVGNEPIIHSEKFAETVATNRGAYGKAFNDLQEAIKWIEGNT